MTARDIRTELFLPSKNGEYGDNWRSLEYWARMTWQPILLLNGWVASDDALNSTPPAYATDGFGNLAFRGAIKRQRSALPFFVLPESARPTQRSIYPVATWAFGETIVWPGAIVVDVDGSCYHYSNLLDAVTVNLTGIFTGLFTGIFTGIFTNLFAGLTNLNNPVPTYGRRTVPVNQNIAAGVEATVVWRATGQGSGVSMTTNAFQVDAAANEGRFIARARIKGTARWDGRYTAHLNKEMQCPTATRVADVTTWTTTNPHYLAVGDVLQMDMPNATFDGTAIVLSTPTSTTFTTSITIGAADATTGPGAIYILLDDDHPPYDTARASSDEYTLHVGAHVEMHVGDRLYVTVGNFTTVGLSIFTGGTTWFTMDRVTAFSNTGTAPADPPSPPSPPDPPSPASVSLVDYPANTVMVVSLSTGPVSLVPPINRPS